MVLISLLVALAWLWLLAVLHSASFVGFVNTFACRQAERRWDDIAWWLPLPMTGWAWLAVCEPERRWVLTGALMQLVLAVLLASSALRRLGLDGSPWAVREAMWVVPVGLVCVGWWRGSGAGVGLRALRSGVVGLCGYAALLRVIQVALVLG